MRRNCKNSWCSQMFDVTEDDRTMLKRFEIDRELDQCSTCRHQNRAMFAPQFVLHQRTSDLSGKHILSAYSPSKPYPVYAIEEWWSDVWDPLEYGRPVDFTRPFFEQFAELFAVVPKMANFNENSENCEFTCGAGNARNAYYSHRVYRSEDVYYSSAITGYNHDIVDCLRCQRSSYLYESVQCIECHNATYLLHCTNTRDSHFCIDCRGCSNCLFCHNLRSKEYHAFNRPVSREEFETLKAKTIDGSFSTLQKNLQICNDIYNQTIWPQLFFINSEDCIGDLLSNCAHCFECYNCFNAVGCRYCWELSPSEQATDFMDVTRGGIGELLYNCAWAGGENYFLRMCCCCRKSSHLTYCIDCYHCRNCFGCSGLKTKQFCILNKEYTEEEYKTVVSTLIAHMQSTGEWGSFFPPTLSPFAYNASSSMAYLPLSEKEIVRRGWSWEKTPEHAHGNASESATAPDNIDDVSDDLSQTVFTCTVSGRKFKIIPQELAYYRLFRQPLPRVHPDLRMNRREVMLNPHHLFDRICAKCNKEIQTSYAPDRPEIIYCESCYLSTVY